MAPDGLDAIPNDPSRYCRRMQCFHILGRAEIALGRLDLEEMSLHTVRMFYADAGRWLSAGERSARQLARDKDESIPDAR